ncbi:hypothetical protein AW736_06145 [Termitidicoccus mucosus]|uniref:Uncharacterized protein n=1 Tax=Termitidicoccus mucosus TaxID=1184151 RepID=A0A178INH9_9BACT|nr:hypothetical protein AW736_06145 [Opitutaceae bacterium TSB47]
MVKLKNIIMIFDACVQYGFRTKRNRSTTNFNHIIGVNIKNLNDTVRYTHNGIRNSRHQICLRYSIGF